MEKRTFNPEVKRRIRAVQTEKEQERLAMMRESRREMEEKRKQKEQERLAMMRESRRGMGKGEEMREGRGRSRRDRYSRRADFASPRLQGFDERRKKRAEDLRKKRHESREKSEASWEDVSGEMLMEDEKLLLSIKRENIQPGELRKMTNLVREKREILKREREYLEDFAFMQEEGGITDEELADDLFEIDEMKNQNEKEFQDLIESNPELWVMHHLQDLREYKRALQRGELAETPSVKEKADEVRRLVHQSEPVALLGHTGSGKSEIAKQIGNEVHKELYPEAGGKSNFHLVPGNDHTLPNDLFGHYTLKGSDNQEKVKELEEKEWGRYSEWVDQEGENVSEEEKRERMSFVMEKIRKSVREEFGGTRTAFEHGPLIKAMEEGKVFILDEANTVPEGTRIALNDVLSSVRADRGKYVLDYNGGEKIKVKPGFCVIITGNVNTTTMDGPGYEGRYSLDPSFIQRFTAIDYDYLPQKTEGDIEKVDESDELFHLMLANVMDRYGNMSVPEGSVEKLWELAQQCRKLQENFAGEGSLKRQKEDYQLKKNVPSTRSIMKVLNAWKKDAYRRSLDYYLEKEFINSIDNETEDAEFIRDVFKRLGNFFQDGYDQPVDRNNREFIHKEQVVEYAFGEMPEHEYLEEEKDPAVVELVRQLCDGDTILHAHELGDDLDGLRPIYDKETRDIYKEQRDKLREKFNKEMKSVITGIEKEIEQVGCAA